MARNAAAEALYTKAGFRRVAVRLDVLRIDVESVDDVEMTLDLCADP